jgi:anti-sigma regulatory factor (Ser/Thr protein kinase)
LYDDEGPGIPNIDQAMEAGFSTASPEVREMGFGAGMGLPNIKNNADELEIQSEVGKGTRLRITIKLIQETA